MSFSSLIARTGLGLFLSLVAAVSVAGPARQALRVCLSEAQHAPWRLAGADGLVQDQGLDFELLRRFASQSGWKLQIHVLPGKRCLAGLHAGELDAALGFSHNAERAAWGHYPMREGRLDESLALRIDSYSLYARAEATAGLQWDGRQLQLPPGRRLVAVQLGHSAGELLRAFKVQVDERARSAEQALRLLQSGEVELAALMTSEAEAQRRQHLSLSSLRRLEPALTVRPYFVVLSPVFAKASPEAVDAVWRAFHAAAQFPRYQQAVREARR